MKDARAWISMGADPEDEIWAAARGHFEAQPSPADLRAVQELGDRRAAERAAAEQVRGWRAEEALANRALSQRRRRATAAIERAIDLASGELRRASVPPTHEFFRNESSTCEGWDLEIEVVVEYSTSDQAWVGGGAAIKSPLYLTTEGWLKAGRIYRPRSWSDHLHRSHKLSPRVSSLVRTGTGQPKTLVTPEQLESRIVGACGRLLGRWGIVHSDPQ